MLEPTHKCRIRDLEARLTTRSGSVLVQPPAMTGSPRPSNEDTAKPTRPAREQRVGSSWGIKRKSRTSRLSVDVAETKANAMLELMYERPSRDDVEECVVGEEVIEQGADPVLGLKREAESA